MSNNYSSRKTRVAEKALALAPPTGAKTITYKYSYDENTFFLHNPYEYNITFMSMLRIEDLLHKLRREMPEPASAVYIRRSRVFIYFIALPILIFILWDYIVNIHGQGKDELIFNTLMVMMYTAMLGLTLVVLFTNQKNNYFDKMHKREKLMRGILDEVNREYYSNGEIVWNAGKYGLFFYGILKKRRSKILVMI